MEIWVRFSPNVGQYIILKRHLVQLDGYDANKTKKTKWQRTLKQAHRSKTITAIK